MSLTTFSGGVEIAVANIGPSYGYLQQEPIVWTSLAHQWQAEDGTAIQGRLVAADKDSELHGQANTKRQDTYTTTAGRVGKPFTVVSGTWRDDHYHEQTHSYGLINPNGSDSEIVAATADTSIVPADIWVYRGNAAAGGLNSNYATGSDSSHQPGNNFTYIDLAYGSADNQNYRIALRWSDQIALEHTYDGTTWERIAGSRHLANLEHYLGQHTNQIRFRIRPDALNNTLRIQVGETDCYFVHTPDASRIKPAHTAPLLPAGKVRVLHRGSVLKFNYFPLRHQAIQLTKSPRDFGKPLSGWDTARFSVNALTNADSSQTVTSQVTGDGQKIGFTVNASLPDAGDGQGSALPPRLSDVALVIPAVWSDVPYGVPSGSLDGGAYLAGQYCVETEVFDDVTRTAYSQVSVVCDNAGGRYNGAYGRIACNLRATNGISPVQQRLQGVGGGGTEGVRFVKEPVQNRMYFTVRDKSCMLQTSLDDEIVLDGWCLWSAVRFLCEKGNIHPYWLQSIPLYIPPGQTADAPYGPAGYDCPYFILPRGTGQNPKFKFFGDITPWAILQLLCQDSGVIDPDTGLPVPFYMGFDPNGQFHFEAVALYRANPVISYSTNDPTGLALIEGGIEVVNSVEDLRSELNFQGLDALTNELLHVHYQQPVWTAIAAGFRHAWTERAARFSSLDYLQYATYANAVPSSLPQQTYAFTAPFWPGLHAGDNCTIYAPSLLGQTLVTATIKKLTNFYGIPNPRTGIQVCRSQILARNLRNTL